MVTQDPQWPRASEWLASGGATDPDAPLLAVLGAPLSATSISPSRADTTPAAVRKALRGYSTLAALGNGTTVDLEIVQVTDLGDVDLADLDGDDAQDLLAAGVAEAMGSPVSERTPDLLLLLGGDNAVTRPAMAAIVTDLARSGLLTLDAHHDVRGWHAGRTNGTPVRGLIEDGLPGEHVVQIGIGMFTNSPAYRRYCDEHGITVVPVAAARAEGVAATVLRHLDALADTCDAVYVDLDVDVLDATFAPGCPGARPGGITPGELVEAALIAAAHPAVVAIDIVEVDAQADVGGITVGVAAQCVLAVAAGLALRPRQG